jgi:putative ABC transport system ATP-binding protein
VGELAWGDVALEFDGRFIEPGRLIGDLSVIRGEKRTLDLVVREKMRGLRIGAPEFIEVISSDPTISMSLLRTVSGYLEEVAAYVRELQRNG